jgi:xanthine dehydrogenase small subunit
MIEFILNDKITTSEKPSGFLLVDLIRYEENLKGTKIGCREGDCGACTVLIGTLTNDKMNYKQVTSCLTPIGNIAGKHVVTIEGLNMERLSPVQQEMVNESGTQCGFCSPGFVVSLSSYCLSENEASPEKGIAAVDGNICRCTGYKSIERASFNITKAIANKDTKDPINWLITNEFLPIYFKNIPGLIKALKPVANVDYTNTLVGGGSDLYVQQPEQLVDQPIAPIGQSEDLRFIRVESKVCKIGAGSTVSDLQNSEVLNQYFPNLHKHIKLVSSSPIRNISTIVGNFVNASPIGDFTIFFLALNAQIKLVDERNERFVKLNEFYNGYKDLDKTESEMITEISFPLPSKKALFNLEKVSKRIHLDIASVNSAIQISVTDNKIEEVHIAAGGIGPIPTYLQNTIDFLTGKPLTPEVLKKANEILQKEISPISDVRGSEQYKRLLIRQLFYAHFIKLFPSQITLTALL